MYGDHGSFTSPNFPGTYGNGTHCEWSIKAPGGRVVTVTFNQISIDDPGDCQNNYLKLYDGPDASTPPVGPYCGAVGKTQPWVNGFDSRESLNTKLRGAQTFFGKQGPGDVKTRENITHSDIIRTGNTELLKYFVKRYIFL